MNQGRPPLVEGVSHDSDWLTVRWRGGQQDRFPAIWLRDNIPSGRHTPEGQRLFDIAQLPDHITLSAATVTAADGVAVTFDPEGIVDTFEAAWLQRHSLDPDARRARRAHPILWSGERQEQMEFVDYAGVTNGAAELTAWLSTVRDYGFGLLRNVPTVPGTVLEVVRLFGFVRETSYGDYTLDAENSPADARGPLERDGRRHSVSACDVGAQGVSRNRPLEGLEFHSSVIRSNSRFTRLPNSNSIASLSGRSVMSLGSLRRFFF